MDTRLCVSFQTPTIFSTFPPRKIRVEKRQSWRKKVSIEVHGKGFDDLYKVLLNEFPQLSNAGGLELLRTGFGLKSKTLEVIPVPQGSTSYAISYLKDVLQQAECYVRP